MSTSPSPGRPSRVDDDELLSALAAVIDPRESPVAAAGDVSAEVAIGRDATLKRLNALADAGRVLTRRVGRSRVFWLPPESDRQTRLTEHEEGVDDGAGEVEERRESQPEESVVDEVRREVEHVDVPGSGEKAERRREAVVAVVAHAVEHDHVTRSVAEKAVYPDHVAGYKSGYSWWTNCIRPALSALAERVDRWHAADTSGEWRAES